MFFSMMSLFTRPGVQGPYNGGAVSSGDPCAFCGIICRRSGTYNALLPKLNENIEDGRNTALQRVRRAAVCIAP